MCCYCNVHNVRSGWPVSNELVDLVESLKQLTDLENVVAVEELAGNEIQGFKAMRELKPQSSGWIADGKGTVCGKKLQVVRLPRWQDL